MEKDIKKTFIKRAFDFSVRTIKIADNLPQSYAFKIIINQLIRSATSIGANMVEAKSASSKKYYINFYTHALKSANETIYWLSLLKKVLKSPLKEISELINEAEELARILGASIITMKSNIKNQK